MNSVRRCYAEAVNIFFVYLSIYTFQNFKNLLGVVLISIGLTLKMNVLLFIPAVYYIVSVSQGIWIGTFYLMLIYAIQELFALPFTMYYPAEYRNTAFYFGRDFNYSASYNFMWVPPQVFSSFIFSNALIIIHLLMLIFVMFWKWVPYLDQNCYKTKNRVAMLNE